MTREQFQNKLAELVADAMESMTNEEIAADLQREIDELEEDDS